MTIRNFCDTLTAILLHLAVTDAGSYYAGIASVMHGSMKVVARTLGAPTSSSARAFPAADDVKARTNQSEEPPERDNPECGRKGMQTALNEAANCSNAPTRPLGAPTSSSARAFPAADDDKARTNQSEKKPQGSNPECVRTRMQTARNGVAPAASGSWHPPRSHGADEFPHPLDNHPSARQSIQ